APAERERRGDHRGQVQPGGEDVALVAEPDVLPRVRRHRVDQAGAGRVEDPRSETGDVVARADELRQQVVLDGGGDGRDLDDAVGLHQLDDRDVSELGDARVGELAGPALDV